MSDEKQTYVRLKLRDLTIIDQFICYSEYGMEAEPAHRVLIHAKGDYDSPKGDEYRIDKLELDGHQIELDSIQIKGVSTKEDCLKSNVHRGHITIYMIDQVFSSFVELLRRDTPTGEIVIKLRARPLKEYPEILRISFDGIDMTHKAGVPIPINDKVGGALARLLHFLFR